MTHCFAAFSLQSYDFIFTPPHLEFINNVKAASFPFYGRFVGAFEIFIARETDEPFFLFDKAKLGK